MAKRHLMDKTNGRCWYCGCELNLMRFNRSGCINRNLFTVDHVVPRIAGGKNGWANTVPACFSCNVDKRSLSLEQYREKVRWQRMGVTRFDESQIAWLLQHRIRLPDPPPVVFYGESLGLHEKQP